ncbi:restriction endonuclease subunit S [Caloranaerobacter sp. TR13]|uniref:restriction endonuclease subunit S n=1 Tax=Caloranaerobacter sp. TR13 TaxID=1302151 RepID=UPI0006D4655B|nr:restriction endonuclease subunit S [Caloranaerobacter sp. TR13]
MQPDIKERIEKIKRGEVPEGYKKTKIGIIPEDWKVDFLENHSDIRGRIGWRGLKQEEYTDEGPYLIAGKHIKSPNIIWDECDHISIERYKESMEIALEVGDVILSKDGSLGNPAYISYLPGKATINSTMMLVRVKSSKLNSKFLYHILNGKQFERLINEKTSGSSIPHLFQRDMKKFRIQLPSLNEQQKIAEILSTWDKAIELKEKLIEEKKKQKKGLMQLLLTDKKRLPGFKGEWKEVKLKRILKPRKEKSKITDKLKLYSLTIEDGVTPKTDRYNREFLVKSNDKQYKITYKNDIVYNPSNLRFGAIALNKNEMPVLLSPIYEVLYVENKNRYCIDFIAHLLTWERNIRYFATKAEGTLVERMAVKLDAFLNVSFLIPLDIKEQKAISKILNDIDKEISLLIKELEALKLQKKGLMQLLLTGIVRVKDSE